MKKSNNGVFLGLNNSGEVISFIKSNSSVSSFVFGTLGRGRAFRVGELTKEIKMIDPESDYKELNCKLGGET